ncbi:MAG: hypothetical protein RIF34_02650 [Candidatus Kapaibacterium sp.]
MKQKIRKLLFEILPVAIGVLMALFIDNFRDSYRDRQYVTKMMSIVRNENSQNMIQISEAIQRQKELNDTISYYLNDSLSTIHALILKVNGLASPDLLHNGSDYLLNSNQVLLDVDQMIRMSNQKNEIDNFHFSNKKLSDLFYQDLGKSDRESKYRFSMVLYDVIYYEERIYQLCKEFNEGSTF